MDLFGDSPSDDDNEVPDLPEAYDAPMAAPLPVEDPASLLPRQTAACLGHAAVERILLDYVASDRVPHGLIFAGIEGIGKATMAYRFARFLLHRGTGDTSQDNLFGDAPAAPETLDIPKDSETFRRVAQNAHPDLLTIERPYDESKDRQKGAVDIEEVRKIAPFLRMTAAGGGWRVVIVDDADTMNRAAQNALLKILEEPPKHTVLILIAHRPGALIPTIRSRARALHFQPLAEAQVLDLLRKHGREIQGTSGHTLVARTAGSFGRALRESGPEQMETMDSVLNLLQSDWRWTDAHVMAETVGAYGQDRAWQTFTDCVLWFHRDKARQKARGGMPSAGSLAQTLKICDKLEAHFARTDIGNLDRRQGVLGAFALIEEEKAA